MDVDNVDVLEEESEEESDWEDEEEDEEEKEEKKKKEEEENEDDSEEESSGEEDDDDDDDIHTVDHIIKKRVVKGKKCSSGTPQDMWILFTRIHFLQALKFLRKLRTY